MTTRKRDAEATQEAILNAAEDLFIEEGFSKVSLTQIASAANVTKSLIHHHFGSKDDLWLAVKKRYFSGYADAQSKTIEEGEPTLELLYNGIVAYFKYLQSKPGFAHMNCRLLLEGDESCLEIFRGVTEAGVEAIRAAQAEGKIRNDLNPYHILITALSMVENYFLGKERFCELHTQLLAGETDPLKRDEAYLKDMMTIYVEGIRPQSPKS